MGDAADDRVQELLLLQRVAQRLASILEVDRLLEQIVEDVAQTFGYTRSAVLLIDEADPTDLVVAAARGWTRFHEPGFRFKVGKEGMVGRVASTGERLYAPDVRREPHYVVSEEATLSEVDTPIRAHGRVIGVFNAQSPEVDGFPPSRLELLELLAGHVGIALENARLFERERREKDRMTKELAAARAIQERLFPLDPPSRSGLTVTGRCLPSREVGGDWYDYIDLPGGRMGVVVADVSGKGLAAALLMSSTRSLLRLIAQDGGAPGAVLADLNRRLCDDFPAGRFVTLIYGVVDPATGTVVFANAGHPWPLLMGSEEPRFLDAAAGLPLGIQAGEYAEERVVLAAGTRLLLYSDGVTEAENPAGEELGFPGLKALARDPGLSIDGVFAALWSFTAGQQRDDVTVVAIGR